MTDYTVMGGGERNLNLPNFGNKVIDVVPSKRAVRDTAEPTQLIGGSDVRMRMDVIRDRNACISERGCDKAYAESRWTGS